MLAPKTKRELQSFLGIVHYLSKFSSMAAEVCEPFRRLTSVNVVCALNTSNQQICERAKSLVKYPYMKYYDVRKPLYLETNTSGVDLVATLLQVRDDLNWWYDEEPDNAMLYLIAFASKSLSSAE